MKYTVYPTTASRDECRNLLSDGVKVIHSFSSGRHFVIESDSMDWDTLRQLYNGKAVVSICHTIFCEKTLKRAGEGNNV